ncbi:MAG: chemotaxis protein CheD [Candidatus Sericytochromatia bacterium]|nr:chemotaxis protein CheD [Candidatus Sericytochromatia bacterium]
MCPLEPPKHTVVNVGMSEHQVLQDPNVILAAPGLGSCIALILYDPIIKVGGMVHVVLPDSNLGRDKTNPWKFADTAVPLLVATVCARGALRGRLWAKIAGGAQMFTPVNDLMNIGARNADAVQAHLGKLNIRLTGCDVGGKSGRTVRAYLADGRVTVKKVGGAETPL